MSKITIEIEIADEQPLTGYPLTKLGKYGQTEAAIIDRIGRANQAAYPNHRYDAVDVLVKAIAAAVAVAEAAVVPE